IHRSLASRAKRRPGTRQSKAKVLKNLRQAERSQGWGAEAWRNGRMEEWKGKCLAGGELTGEREKWGEHPIGDAAHFWFDGAVVKMVSLGSGGLLVGDRPFYLN